MSGPDESEGNDSGILEPAESLVDRGVEDVLDEGESPAERPWVGQDWGITAREEAEGESLDGRLAREVPDEESEDGDGLGDTSDTDGELLDDQVGNERAGRLVESDEGGVVDYDEELYATDVGIDGAAASAEEAAVHVVDSDSPDER
jgi:Family of unknown function (DUF5709)